MERLCADVLVFGPVDGPLLYAIPPGLESAISAGVSVRVPLGRRMVLGVVTGIRTVDTGTLRFQTREIHAVEDGWPPIGGDLLALIPWVGGYYFASTGSVLEAVIPAAVRKNTIARVATTVTIARILDDGERGTMFGRAPGQRAIYDFLLANGNSMPRSSLKNFSPSALRALLRSGIVVETTEREGFSKQSDRNVVGDTGQVTLTAEQQLAAAAIAASLDGGKFCTHLLHGITGSGKTEVYLHGIRKVLAAGGGVIYLVPELALTPQSVRRLEDGLASIDTTVTVWHSGLSDGERRNAWLAMASGRSSMAIGARSAVFAPLKNVRLIVVDEEHETAYKQAETPRYNGRDVAIYRAKLCDAVCVLGSATPSVESAFNAATGKYKSNTLKSRIDGRTLPRMEVVDMHNSRGGRTDGILTERLRELIADRLAAHEQTILFLNRRGFATVVFCNDCNYTATCPHCSTSLTYHKQRAVLLCHLCGYVERLPEKCPRCGSHKVLWSGIGTQRLASATGEMFPTAKIGRLDSDTMGTKDGFRKTLEAFGAGAIDILIGTQMIAKGLDFPNVSLVGIVNVDGAMGLPDFRANERVFQSIVQVSGRAGRGSRPGIVVIQTRCPTAEPIALAVGNDGERFLANELEMRREFGYPPFARIVRLIFSGVNERKTAYLAEKFSDGLSAKAAGTFVLRGPAPAAIQKTKDRFRFSLLCFTKNIPATLDRIAETMAGRGNTRDFATAVDVDPIDML
jgi:primosomal protein N' (replication factor Y)